MNIHHKTPILKPTRKDRSLPLALMAVSVIVGIAVLPVIFAAGTAVVVEPETGTISSPATTIADATASGGKAVKFGATPAPTSSNATLLFGLGDYAGTASTTRLATTAPIKMLTNWYTGTDGLAVLPQVRSDALKFTAQGYSMQLMVWMPDDASDKTTTQTAYGPACGVAYPISSRFNDDMRQVAQAYAGTKLYVTMFFEVQAYSCDEQQRWSGNEAYFNALKDSYKQALATFHQYAPGSKVSLDWGGWLTTWDNPATGQGKSMLPHFADVLGMSDFQSFGAVASGSGANLQTVQQLTPLLHAYGNKPVMISPFGRYAGDNLTTLSSDITSIFNDATITQAVNNGLFAVGVYKDNNFADNTDYQTMLAAIKKYSAWPVTAP